MAVWQGFSKRKITGKRIVRARKHRKFDLGRAHLETKIGSRRVKDIRCLGGNQKLRILSDELVNVFDPKKKTQKRVKVTSVVENTANPHYVRRGIITKGAIIETEAGKARVTSRPGQHGILNAVLIQ